MTNPMAEGTFLTQRKWNVFYKSAKFAQNQHLPIHLGMFSF